MHPPHITEIIERTPFEYNQEELIDLVQYYIKYRKGVDVSIGIYADNLPYMINQINMLSSAFDYARNWLLENRQ